MRAFFIVALVFVAGCSAAPFSFEEWSYGRYASFWPSPPDQRRIELIGVVPDQKEKSKESPQDKFLTWLLGERNVPSPLVAPYAVVADGEGLIWVTDTEGRSVHRFDLSSGVQSVWFSVEGTGLVAPLGLGIDREGKRLYLSDSVLRKVFVLDYEGRFLGDITVPGGFERPTGLVVDQAGNLYVSDTKTGFVYKLDRSGTLLKVIGSGIAPDGKFNLQVNLAVDQRGNLFVVDSMNFRVEVFSSEGVSVGTIGELGDAAGYFARPRGVAVDSQGQIYVADAAFSNIQVFDQAGHLLLVFGESGFAPGEFVLPAGLFFDQRDHLYVVDAYNQRVQVFQYLHVDN